MEEEVIALDDHEELIRKLKRLERRHAEAKGAYQQILKRLKKEFGCDTLEEAEKLLEELKTKELKAHRKYVREKKQFTKKHRKALEDL